MFRKLFYKYYVVFATSVTLCFVVLGLALLALAQDYARQEKTKSLYSAALNISNLTTQLIETNSLKIGNIFEQSLMAFSNNGENDVYITDSSGKIIIAVREGRAYTAGGFIDSDIVAVTLSSGGYNQVGRLGGLYADNQYVVGLPYLLDERGGYAGAVFVASSTRYVTRFLRDLAGMFLLATALVLLIAFVGLYYSTNRLVKPLTNMAKAANSFARGDFSARVKVSGRDEMGNLAASLNAMADSLAQLEMMRRDFVASVSHELRTPMTTVSGFVDGILDGTIPKDKESYYLRIVSDEVRRLSRLVNALLDLVRIQAKEISLSPSVFDICETVRLVLLSNEMRIDAKNLGVEFEADEDRMNVLADESIIHVVVSNLIDNAIKFTPAGGRIRISIRTVQKKVHVSVCNYGAGIPKEDLPHVFDRFYKVDKSRGLDRKSVGLGLYISKTIINMHNESMWVASAENEYTQFTFTLPAFRAPREARERKNESEKL